MTVVDASALLEMLLRSEIGLAIEARLLRPAERLHAPALLDVEVAQVLRRYVSRGELSEEYAAMALRLMPIMPIERHAHEPLLDRIWALRSNLTAYDAAYVALAEGLRVPLVTCDERLASAPGVGTPVEVFR